MTDFLIGTAGVRFSLAEVVGAPLIRPRRAAPSPGRSITGRELCDTKAATISAASSVEFRLSAPSISDISERPVASDRVRLISVNFYYV